MKTRDPWQLLKAGNVFDGIQLLKRDYEREPTASRTVELGVAYLWVKQLEEALAHFQSAIRDYPQSMAIFYGMAGTAAWCLGNFKEAVMQWQGGLDSDYADTNGLGVKLPLLLLVASILRPDSFEKQKALKFLRDKSRDCRIKEWPGPIVFMALGEIDGPGLRHRWMNVEDLEDQQWLTSFYETILAYRVGEESLLQCRMQSLADTSRAPWENHDFFLARMWSEEFFLARENELHTPTIENSIP